MDITTKTQTNETKRTDPAFQPVGSPWLLAATLTLGIVLGWLLRGNFQGDAAAKQPPPPQPPCAVPGNT